MKDDLFYMQRALELAKKGRRAVAPNPMVGAVIVKGGNVIGEGYHQQFGAPHAEVNAIQSVQNQDDLIGSTLYVTLEPCRHYGKTPPCQDLIEKVGIKKVVIGSHDSFQQALVINDLTFMSLDLKGDIGDQCKELNKFFFTWVTKSRPYVTVKIAMSADEFIAGEDGHPVHFTSPEQDREVHQLRADHQAILVGINTILNDDSRLNVRYVKGLDPLRVIVDSALKIPLSARVLADRNVLVATSCLLGQTNCPISVKEKEQRLKGNGFNIWQSKSMNSVDLNELLVYLGGQGISSVLVEPGPSLYRSLKNLNLIDELIVFRGSKSLKKGLRIEF